MKTRVLVDNKARIRRGLEPIQPEVTEVEFQISELTEAEREWVAKHYVQDTIFATLSPRLNDSHLLRVENIEPADIISAIRACVGKPKRQFPKRKGGE